MAMMGGGGRRRSDDSEAIGMLRSVIDETSYRERFEALAQREAEIKELARERESAARQVESRAQARMTEAEAIEARAKEVDAESQRRRERLDQARLEFDEWSGRERAAIDADRKRLDQDRATFEAEKRTAEQLMAHKQGNLDQRSTVIEEQESEYLRLLAEVEDRNKAAADARSSTEAMARKARDIAAQLEALMNTKE